METLVDKLARQEIVKRLLSGILLLGTNSLTS